MRDSTLQQLLEWSEDAMAEDTTFVTTHTNFVQPLLGRLRQVAWNPAALLGGSAEYLVVFEHPSPYVPDPRGYEVVRNAAFELEPVARFIATREPPQGYIPNDFYFYPLRDPGALERAGPDIAVYRRRAEVSRSAGNGVPKVVPGGLLIKHHAHGQPLLCWTQVEEAAVAALRVHVFARKAGATSSRAVAKILLPPHTTQLPIVGLPSGSYEARVAAVGLDGPGRDSAPIPFTIGP